MARGVYSATNFFLYGGGLVTATPLTMACWVNPSAFATNQALMGITYTAGAAAALDGWILRLALTTGYVEAVVGDSTASNAATKATTPATAAWSHAAAVFTSSTSRYAYLNGSPSSQDVASRLPSASADKTALGVMIRQNNSVAAQAAQCYIAEAAVWNATLTTAELLLLAAGYSPLFVRQASLLAYYPLIRGDASGDEPDLWRGLKMVEQGTVAAQPHTRVFYPAPRPISKYVPAVGGGPMIPVFMNQYRQRRA